ncbi:MAG: ribosome silencing factor [Flavobacteriales bacterium]|nr:ribosome silencing factor [Flavobacteriales bacterium]MBK7556674.1 ribosome silencing factor [Flavobacteriales bacterium]MBK9193963.1 ribosome silencing factor [Flavobacteriales bacterium]MBP6574812.1 ribosome silencing factor [Flavobacteriales bacterium]
MKKATDADQSVLLTEAIVLGIQEVKGRDIVTLDLRGVPNSMTYHFVICHGDSDTQVQAIAASVERFARERMHEKPWHVEGERNAEWILLDYVHVVVHIFNKTKRGFYGLEDLWADAARRTYPNVA